MVFPILYLTRKADFNVCRLWKVDLIDYTRYLLCFRDRRFSYYSWWKFLVFNLLI
jgi:hypothetical protein